MPCSANFLMTLQIETLLIETSDFLKQIIFLILFNSVFTMALCSQARAGRSVVQSSSSGNLLQTLLYPLMFIWNFLYSMFFGAGVSSSSSSQQRGEPMDQSSGQTNRPSS